MLGHASCPLCFLECRNDSLQFNSKEELQVLLQHLQDLYNQTHQWILKGWTSQKVFEKFGKPALRPLPKEPFVFPHKVIAEVGRNDTCPCGSGKKYKKCCLAKQH